MSRPHPLVDADYNPPPDQLPRSQTPAWMWWSLICGLIASLVMAFIVLGGPMDEVVAVEGEVRPAEDHWIYPASDGVLAECVVKAGQSVATGAVLARLDSTDLRHARARVEAELLRIEAEVTAARAVRLRTIALPLPPEIMFSAQEGQHQRRLVDQQREALGRLTELESSGNASLLQVVAQQGQLTAAELQLARHLAATAAVQRGLATATIAESETKILVIEAQGEMLRRQLAEFDERLARQVIHAPTAGMVVGWAVRYPGEQVRVGFPVCRLALSPVRELKLEAGEDRISRIRPGAQIRFRSRSDADRLRPMRKAEVTEVALDRTFDLNAKDNNYRITASIAGMDASDLPFGARVDAEVVLDERPLWRLLFLQPSR